MKPVFDLHDIRRLVAVDPYFGDLYCLRWIP